MRKLILSAAMAATALGGITLPATASAQPGNYARPDWQDDRRDDRRDERRDDRRDNWRDDRRGDARDVRDARRDVREERGELRDAWRRGDRDDIRDERRDVRRAENRYSRELRDYRGVSVLINDQTQLAPAQAIAASAPAGRFFWLRQRGTAPLATEQVLAPLFEQERGSAAG